MQVYPAVILGCSNCRDTVTTIAIVAHFIVQFIMQYFCMSRLQKIVRDTDFAKVHVALALLRKYARINAITAKIGSNKELLCFE